MPPEHLLKKILERKRHEWDHPGTRPAVRENFLKMLACRTPALGWEVYASETEEKICYHTCKSRSCPSCGYRATLLWQEEQEAVLPEIPYGGVVFTMSNVPWRIFKQNRHLLHDLPAIGSRRDPAMGKGQIWLKCARLGGAPHLWWRLEIQYPSPHFGFCRRSPRVGRALGISCGIQ